jgi:hypothetical protein
VVSHALFSSTFDPRFFLLKNAFGGQLLDGTRAIDIVVNEGVSVDRVTVQDIKDAMAQVLEVCIASSYPNAGGFMGLLGMCTS